MRRSSSCGGALGFDCSIIPQLKRLQASGTAAYTAPEVVQATFNHTPLEAAVGPQVRAAQDLSTARTGCQKFVACGPTLQLQTLHGMQNKLAQCHRRPASRSCWLGGVSACHHTGLVPAMAF
jgi:hypothetical protein